MYICQNDIKKAFIKVGIGAEKKSRITDKEKRITAFHEAGHAILFHLLPDVGPVYTVSIIPTGVEPQVIPCRYRKKTKCSIQRGTDASGDHRRSWRSCGGRTDF